MIPFLDALIGSGGSLTGSSGGAAFGAGLWDMGMSMMNAGLDSLGLSQHGRDQYFNRETQREFLESQQQFQREILGYNQNFTKEMYERQWKDMLSKYPELAQKLNDQQFNLWKNQFQMQNEWNSPGNQQQLLMAAGRNPVANAQGLTSQSSMGASSAVTPPQISPTPFQGSGSPIGLPQGMSGRGTTLSDIGNFLKDVSQMHLNNKQTGRYDEKIDAEIQASLAKAGLDNATSEYRQLMTKVDSFFLPQEKASQVKLNMAKAAQLAAEGDKNAAEARLDDALAELNKTKNDEAKAHLPFIELEARAEIDDIHASAEEKRANAQKARQEAQTEKYNTEIQSIRAETDAKTKVSKIVTILNSLRKDRVLNEASMSEARLKFRRLQAIQRDGNLSTIFNEADAILNWLTSHIGVAINGNVSTSSSSIHHE